MTTVETIAPPYGQIAQSNGSAMTTYLGYAGQLLDPSGLYYMRARWYDPASGRFLTRDPLRGISMSPVSLNSFGYGGANPVLMLDPSGLSFDSGDDIGLCDTSACGRGQDLKKVFTCLDVYCRGQTYAQPSDEIDSDQVILCSPVGAACAIFTRTTRTTRTPPSPPNTPSVADKALQKIIDAIWKAANNQNRSGDGSTMAAIADELATGQTTFGKLHRGAGMDQIRSLSNWLDKNPNAAAYDRQIAVELVRRLLDALQGR